MRSFQGIAASDQHTVLGALPDANHNGGRRRKPERAGAGDDQHRHEIDERMGERRRRSEHEPKREGDRGDSDHGRHEIGRDPIREPGERRFRRLRFFHKADDPSQGHLAPNLGRLDPQASGPIEGGTDHQIAWLLVHRKAFACEHGFIHR